MRSDLGRLLSLWRARWGWLGFGLGLSMAGLLAGGALLGLSGATLVWAAAGLALAPFAPAMSGLGRAVLRYAERLGTHAAMFRALADLRVWFFRRLAESGAGGLGFRKAGDLLSRLVSDVEALDGLYLRLLIPMAGAALLLPVLVVVPLILRGAPGPWLAAVLGALFLAAALALPVWAYCAARETGVGLARATAAMRVVVLDTFTGLREVRAFGAEGRMLAAMQASEATLLAEQDALARRVALAGMGGFLCAQAGLAVALAAAGMGVAGAVITAFVVVAAFEVVSGLPRAGAYAATAAAALRRVLAAADEPVAVPDPARSAPMPKGLAQGHTIRFESVRFRWLPDRPYVFDGLSLHLHPGARVAILGPSGSGKSTLAALLLKVAAPEAGLVTLDGVDLRALPAASVRARIAWLSQTTHLFDDTIRANLLLAKPTASDAELWAALDAARMGDVARALPDGLDSWVGEGGARFSGGQARRLALARALLSDAPILILDEPCASLDAETERAFLTTLNSVAEGRSVVLIAHRLVGVERLDRIYRLSGGVAVAAAA
jgi:ATP-binding cassette subfamily C protein CydC